MDGASRPALEARGLKRAWLCLRLAASFLTLIPAGPRAIVSPGLASESFGFFPLIGFAIGIALGIEDRLLQFLLPIPLGSLVVIVSALILTGGLHLDALADTADALGAKGDRVRALEILRDPHAGAFGVLAIVCWLCLEWAALASLAGWPRAVALYIAFGLSRWTTVAVTSGMEYLRAQGAGSFISPADTRRDLRRASLLAVVALIPVLSWRTLLMVAVAAGMTGAARAFFRRWLGGVTGDLIGAAGAGVEMVMLLVAAIHPASHAAIGII